MRDTDHKSYIEYDVHLLMLSFFDLAGVRVGDKLSSLRPTTHNWTTA
ncbi:hypothetical protein LINPERHAP1_LOCUS190 [Linum perenne]